MAEDDFFRVALIVVMLTTLSVTAYHRVQAAASGEKISRSEEGLLLAVTLRLSGLLLLLSTLAWLLFPASVQWAVVPLPAWIRWGGVVSGVLCSLLMYWTLSSLGHNLTDTVMIRAAAALVTNGPYRWVRHPFYVTSALVIASVTIITANWLIGVCGLLVLGLLAVRTPKEERMLLDRFGPEYQNYMDRTGRFLPRLW